MICNKSWFKLKFIELSCLNFLTTFLHLDSQYYALVSGKPWKGQVVKRIMPHAGSRKTPIDQFKKYDMVIGLALLGIYKLKIVSPNPICQHRVSNVRGSALQYSHFLAGIFEYGLKWLSIYTQCNFRPFNRVENEPHSETLFCIFYYI